MPASKGEQVRGPKTELDEKFLSVARQVMKAHGITSDRAISLAIGRKADFINRVSNGAQSATPEAWDTLLNKYPEARNITTTNVMAQGGGQAVGTVHGDNHYTLNDCERERERDAYKNEVESLRQQLVDKEKLITTLESMVASKEEIISLLRGGYNRPN
jgi:hypothetical protein